MAGKVRDILNERCINKIFTVAEIMSALVDQSILEGGEREVIEDVENTVSYYAILNDILFEDYHHNDVDFDMLPEWLLGQNMTFLHGLLTVAQMSLDDKNVFLNEIAELNELSEQDAMERRIILLESVVRGG